MGIKRLSLTCPGDSFYDFLAKKGFLMAEHIVWIKDIDEAVAEAPRERKPLFLHFLNPG
jgi:hypothetical protein